MLTRMHDRLAHLGGLMMLVGAFSLGATMLTVTTGCSEDDAEDVADDIGDAVHDAGDAVEDAADDAADEVKDATN